MTPCHKMAPYLYRLIFIFIVAQWIQYRITNTQIPGSNPPVCRSYLLKYICENPCLCIHDIQLLKSFRADLRTSVMMYRATLTPIMNTP